MIEVSVLMSVYNTPLNYLKASVESVLSQTFQYFEFVIIDDASDDLEVQEYLRTISGFEKVVLYRNEYNIGLTKSLNIGMSLCCGRYIARIDADDIAHPRRLEIQFNYMENNEDICVLGTKVDYIIENNARLHRFIDYTFDQELYQIKMLFHNVGPVHPSCMLRKSFLELNKISYRENYKKSQDYALWLDCLNAGGKIFDLKEKLLYYRVHKNQITLKDSKEQNNYMDEISSKQIQYVFGLKEKDTRLLSDLYNGSYLERPPKYIQTIEKLLIANSELDIYDKRKIDIEVKERWIHKIIKCAIKNRDFRGFFCLYTYRCIFSKALIMWMRNMVFRVA